MKNSQNVDSVRPLSDATLTSSFSNGVTTNNSQARAATQPIPFSANSFPTWDTTQVSPPGHNVQDEEKETEGSEGMVWKSKERRDSFPPTRTRRRATHPHNPPPPLFSSNGPSFLGLSSSGSALSSTNNKPHTLASSTSLLSPRLSSASSYCTQPSPSKHPPLTQYSPLASKGYPPPQSTQKGETNAVTTRSIKSISDPEKMSNQIAPLLREHSVGFSKHRGIYPLYPHSTLWF